MTMNKMYPLISWKLVWYVICVFWVSVWMFIVLFMFLVFDLFLSKKLCFRVFFLVLICFLFDYLFFFSFRSNHGFQFGSGLNQYFRVKSIGFFMSSTKALFGWFLLLLRNFWPKRLFDKHTFRSILTVLFWIKKIFLPNRAPNKFPKKISRTNLNLFLDSSHIFPAILFIKRVVDLHCKMLS
jgi:hypothetical protein